MSGANPLSPVQAQSHTNISETPCLSDSTKKTLKYALAFFFLASAATVATLAGIKIITPWTVGLVAIAPLALSIASLIWGYRSPVAVPTTTPASPAASTPKATQAASPAASTPKATQAASPAASIPQVTPAASQPATAEQTFSEYSFSTLYAKLGGPPGKEVLIPAFNVYTDRYDFVVLRKQYDLNELVNLGVITNKEKAKIITLHNEYERRAQLLTKDDTFNVSDFLGPEATKVPTEPRLIQIQQEYNAAITRRAELSQPLQEAECEYQDAYAALQGGSDPLRETLEIPKDERTLREKLGQAQQVRMRLTDQRNKINFGTLPRLERDFRRVNKEIARDKHKDELTGFKDILIDEYKTWVKEELSKIAAPVPGSDEMGGSSP